MLTAGRVPQQRLPGWLSEACTEIGSGSSQKGSQTRDVQILSCDTWHEFPTLLGRAQQPSDQFDDKDDNMCSKSGGLRSNVPSDLGHDAIELKRSARPPMLPKLANSEAQKKVPVEQNRTAGEMILGIDFRKSIERTSRTDPRMPRRSASNTGSSSNSARISSSSTRASSCSSGRRSEHSQLYSATSHLLADNCLTPWKM